MGAGADNDQHFVGALIEQYPVATEVAFAAVLEGAGELMVPDMRWEWFARLQE